MSIFRGAVLALAVLATLPVTSARSQQVKGTASAPAARDPGDPKAAVPSVRYTSAFQRYRANAEVEVAPWRASNDNVGRIGGWRIYGKEAASEAPVNEQSPGNRPPDTGSGPQPPHGHRH